MLGRFHYLRHFVLGLLGLFNARGAPDRSHGVGGVEPLLCTWRSRNIPALTPAPASTRIAPGRLNHRWRPVMPGKQSDLVVIETVQGEMTAQIMKTHLESEGIPVLLKSESLGTIYGLIADGLGAVKIMVPREFAEEAKQIVRGNATSGPG
jgi:hypothetical protein